MGGVLSRRQVLVLHNKYLLMESERRAEDCRAKRSAQDAMKALRCCLPGPDLAVSSTLRSRCNPGRRCPCKGYGDMTIDLGGGLP